MKSISDALNACSMDDENCEEEHDMMEKKKKKGVKGFIVIPISAAFGKKYNREMDEESPEEME